jgi:hypothetical protein
MWKQVIKRLKYSSYRIVLSVKKKHIKLNLQNIPCRDKFDQCLRRGDNPNDSILKQHNELLKSNKNLRHSRELKIFLPWILAKFL